MFNTCGYIKKIIFKPSIVPHFVHRLQEKTQKVNFSEFGSLFLDNQASVPSENYGHNYLNHGDHLTKFSEKVRLVTLNTSLVRGQTLWPNFYIDGNFGLVRWNG